MSKEFIPDEIVKKQIQEALDLFEGIFQFTVDPSKLNRAGRITIHLDGVPKEHEDDEIF